MIWNFLHAIFFSFINKAFWENFFYRKNKGFLKRKLRNTCSLEAFLLGWLLCDLVLAGDGPTLSTSKFSSRRIYKQKINKTFHNIFHSFFIFNFYSNIYTRGPMSLYRSPGFRNTCIFHYTNMTQWEDFKCFLQYSRKQINASWGRVLCYPKATFFN